MIFKSILKFDLRTYQFHEHFGSSAYFASLSESHFSDNVPLSIEPIGSVQCTQYSAIKVGFSQTGNNYDVDKAWTNTPHTDQGATPQDSLASDIKFGLFNVATQLWDKIWASYFQCNKNPNFDCFDSCRSAMMTTKSAITVATNFYSEWLNLLRNEVVPQGKTVISEHDWVVLDWTTQNGEIMFWVDFHIGQRQLMSRDEFNLQVSKLGCGAYVPYSQAVAKDVEVSFIQMLIDLLSRCGNYFANSILALQRVIIQLNS